MPAAGLALHAAGLPPVFRQDVSSSFGRLNSVRLHVPTRRFDATAAVTTTSSSNVTENGRYNKEDEEDETVLKPVMESEEERESLKLKDYFEQSKDLIRSDGGPPRWFSPLECGTRLEDSPLLLFLPGVDGVGLGLITQHQRLGEIFDIWCLHIPVMNRTSFKELVKLVERTIKSENCRSPNRPIYIVGESLGGCLALAVAARNPDIDLVLVLANPATSFSKSLLQPLIPLLEVMPDQVYLSLPYTMSLTAGNPLRMAMASFEKGLSLQQTIEELSQGLVSLSSYFSVLADILPRETLLWKLQMLETASAYANSRLHAVKAQTLILSSVKDRFLPSQEEGERLRRALQKCELRKFNDSDHFIFLEDGVDLVTIIKGCSYYRHGRYHDYVSDYIPPTALEFKNIYEPNRWMETAFSPVVLSTLEDGKIVRNLDGIPSEGPVLLIGYHMLLGLELVPMVTKFMIERNINVRGIAHPMMFKKLKDGRLPELSSYDTLRVMGAVPVSATNFYKLLSSKSHVLLYPGGMREALHRKGEEYKLFWPEQSEFVRMAARFGAKIIPFGAVGEDDIADAVKDRAAILSLHTQKWPKPVAGSLLKWIAKRTAGFAGADLQALCTQVAVIALKRNCPLHKLLSAAADKAPYGNRVPLPAFVVEERDWLEALSCAPPPCSQREAGMAAYDVVSSPLPAHLISCLLQPLSSLLVSLYLDERLFLPPPLSKAAMTIKKVIVAALDKKKVPSDCWWAHVKNLLQEAEVGQEIEREFACAGILIRDATYAGSNLLNDDNDDGNEKVEVSKVHDGYRSSLLRNTYHASGKNSGFRILIAGSPRSGQRHLASCILHCFVGNVEIQKVDLATISQEGRGDVLQGITQILMKCSSVGSCVVFMPRIDLWAINTYQQEDEKESDSCSTNHQLSEMESCLRHGQDPEKENDSSLSACESMEDATPEDTVQKASLAWSSFIEQVDSICMSTSLMILATSEKPYQELPIRIRKFFNIDISNCNEPTPEYTVPRFSVQADGNFNRDVVIISSSAKLSRDVIQQFVQLIHHRTHTITSSCGEYKTCNTFESDPDVVCHGTDDGSANQRKVLTHPAKDSLVKAPLPPNNRFEKGKSNLLLAISTFGYQILRYPHFSELCWVTSKLKEGPCTDINGPWKGWPFNSCIVRPDNSSEKIDDASSSNNLKSKEKPGVVRGLVAVGLSAYRGVYASLREVSLEVRKVFELLVLQINTKIEAGKAKHQFVRILSQVAYLEDVVNSWAYTLQSLEQDARVTGANPQPSTVRSSDDHNMRANNLVQGEECKLDVPMRSAHELVGLEENPHKLAPENNECVDLRNGDGGFPNLNVKVQMPEKGPPHQMVLDHSDPNNTHLQNSPTAAAELCISENTGNHTMESGDFGSLKYSNGFATKESAAISEDGPSSSDGPVGIKLSRSSEVCNQVNGFSLMKAGFQSEDGNSKPKENVVSLKKSTSVSAAAQAVCLYGCCAQCLHAIHGLMQKILMHEWKLNGNSTTVEDVHEVVATLSMNLLSALRKDYVANDFSNSFEEIPSYQNRGKLFELQERHGTCQQCRNSENKLFTPVNCSCHSMSGSSDNQNTSPIPQLELDTRFIYRDGVLAPVVPVKDLSFHCKFETLCLCSLIDWIAMTQKSLD